MGSKVLLSGVFASLSMFSNAVERPNVLFILVDDMQRTSIGGFGNGDVDTPNIDSLIRGGVTFRNAHVNGSLSGAVSMPSRAMIMTGRGIFRIQADGQSIPESHTTLGEHLRESGYDTFGTGKWHSDKRAFNRTFADGDNIFFGGMHRYELNGHVSPRLNHYDATGEYKERAFIADKFSSEMYADAAVDFIKSVGDGGKPFFAYVAFTSPHDPHDKLPEYSSPTSTAIVTLPVNYASQHAFDNGELGVRDETVVPAPRTKETVLEQNQWYGGMINEVGQQIERLLDELTAQGLDDNTVVVFASDNGLSMGCHGLMGKQNLYEHSISVPMSIYVPGNKPQQNDGLCYLSDITPTLYKVLGVDKPESVTTKVLPLNGGDTQRDALVLGYSSIQRALVWNDFKYIIYRVKGKKTTQLFNLKNDPFEMTNLAENPKYKNMTDKYHGKLASMMKDNGDFCDINTEFWWKDGHEITWHESMDLVK